MSGPNGVDHTRAHSAQRITRTPSTTSEIVRREPGCEVSTVTSAPRFTDQSANRPTLCSIPPTVGGK